MRNLKKILALVVVLVMSLSMVITANAVAVFPDVDSADDYADAISMLKSLNVLAGDDTGNFNPEKTITRAEFTKVLFVLMNGTPDASLFVGPSVFTDVSNDFWANGYINWASNLNIVNGKGDNKFAPQDPVTSHEATKMFIVALTGKSSLAWPYGFVAEANKANISLFKDATVADFAKPATRNLIAQFCNNAIFATDVATFYVYDNEGKITAKPSAATAVFGISKLASTIYETSYESWSLGALSAVDLLTVINENNETVKIGFSSESVGDYTGYSAAVYYKDTNKNNKLDATGDTVLNVAVGDCSVAVAKPLNILSLSSTYQLQGITFAPATDLSPKGKLFVMTSAGAVTNVPLTAAALVPYMGALTTSSTATYGPDNDFDVKVVKDNDTGLITNVYVTNMLSFAKVTTFNSNAGLLGLDDTTFGVKATAPAGSAPNKTQVDVADGVAVGDYVMAAPKRDFNGVTWTVSPLLANKAVVLTGIKGDAVFNADGTLKTPGSAVFGDIVYKINTQVAAAVTAGKLPDSKDVLATANLGKKLNVYLDSTGRNYLFAELADGTTTTDNYVFVKSVNTTTAMGVATRTMTVVNAANETKTYTLDLTATGDLGGYLGAGVEGWAAVDGADANATADYAEITILNKVVKLTLDTDGEVSKIDGLEVAAPNGLGGTYATPTSVSFDAGFKTLSAAVNPAAAATATYVGSVPETAVVFYYNAATKALTVYAGKDLPGFSGASATYLVKNAQVKVALFSNMGSAVAGTNVTRGIVTSYNTLAGSTSGKVKYVITAVANGALTAELTTAEESIGGTMSQALDRAKGSKYFVDFGFAADGDTVASITVADTQAGSAVVDKTAGWYTGTVTASYNGLYEVMGVDIVGSKVVATLGSKVYCTLASEADIYTSTTKPATSVIAPSGTIGLGDGNSLAAETVDTAFPMVFHMNDKNVIDTAFVYSNIGVSTATLDTSLVVGDLKVASSTATSMTFTWTAVPNAAKYNISYTITPSGGAAGAPVTTSVSATSFMVTGLNAGDKVDLSIKAALASTVSVTAATVSGTLATKASVPAVAKVTPTSAQIVVDITPNAAAEAVTKYTVMYKNSAGVEKTFDVVPDANGVLTPKATIKSLAGDTYTVKVSATNTLGTSDYCDYTVGYNVPLAKPTGLAATTVGDKTATVSWTAVTNATGYTVTISPAATDGLSTFDIVGNATVSRALINLTSGTEYTVTVKANGTNLTAVSPASDSLKVKPYAKIGAPKNVVVTSGVGQLTADWDDNDAAQSVTKYIVSLYKNYSVDPTQTVEVTASAFNMTGLTAGDIYTIKVQAVNAGATSSATAGDAQVTIK